MCPICDHDQREAIDASLRAVGLRPTLRAFPGLKQTSTHVHRTVCLGITTGREDYRANMPPPMPRKPPASTSAGGDGSDRAEPATGQAEPGAAVAVEVLEAAAPDQSPAPDHDTLDVDTLAPEDATTYADRVRCIAGMVLARTWGYGSVPALARTWGVDERTVRHAASAAGIALELNRGNLPLLRAQAIADTEHLRDLALDGDEPDLRVGVQAQAHLDRLRGVLSPAAPLVSVSIRAAEEDNALDVFFPRLVEALRPFPGAGEAAVNLLATLARERREAVGLGSGQGEPLTFDTTCEVVQ